MTRKYPSLDLLYTETRDRVIRQGATIEHVNTKTSIIVGVDAVLLGAILGILTSMESMVRGVATTWRPWVIPSLASISAILSLLSLVFSVIAFRPRNYNEVLDPKGAYNKLMCLKAEEFKLKLLHTMICSYENTGKVIDKNLKWFQVSLWTLASAMSIAVVTAGLYMYGTVWG